MGDDRSAAEAAARRGVDTVRLPVAIGLLGVNAVWLVVSVVRLVVPGRVAPSYLPDEFADRAAAQFLGFAGLLPIVLPLLAVLLSRHAGPLVRRSDLIALLALGQYAVSLIFGAVSLVAALARRLTDTVSTADGRSFSTWRSALEDGLVRTGFLVLLALAALVVLRSVGAPRRARAGGPPVGVPPGGFGQPYGSPPGFPGGSRTAPRHGAGAQPYGEGRPAAQDLSGYVRRQDPVAEPSRAPHPGAGAGAGAGERTQVLSAEARDALERARIEASLRSGQSGQHGPPPARQHEPYAQQQQQQQQHRPAEPTQHVAPALQQSSHPSLQQQLPPWAALRAAGPPPSGPPPSGPPPSGPPPSEPAYDDWPPEPQAAVQPPDPRWPQTGWPLAPEEVDDAERTRRLDGPGARRGPDR